MKINITQEIYKLRAEYLKSTSQSPLPITVKLMIANELVTALSNAEVNELRIASINTKKEPTSEDKKEE
jgi:hypothetical protein